MAETALLHSLTNCLASVNYHCVIAGFEHIAVQPVLLWFRRNLRLSDNAALTAAAESGRPVIPIYILDDQDVGGASRWWLHYSLISLDSDLRQIGSSLVLRSGSPNKVLAEIAEQAGATEYLTPIVDHGPARHRALEAYQSIKGMRASKHAP